jgi:Phytanoyl-CoA dioxygenase (PhyH)
MLVLQRYPSLDYISYACGVPMTSTESILKSFQDPNFWLTLNPGLSITSNTRPVSALKFEPEQLASVNKALQTDGYFQLEALLPEIEVFLMGVGIESLHEASIAPVFAFVYDEYWQVYTRLVNLLSGVLGDGYYQLPSFWAWYVTQTPADSGWGAHRDNSRTVVLRPDQSPNIITVWLPLSDATPLNGCMYVLPAYADPAYLDSQLNDWKVENEKENIVSCVQAIRALPAAAGSILGWTHALFHWGSQSSTQAESPRISLSVEFQRADVLPYAQNLLQPLVIPSFEQRLRLISQQILNYRHMYNLSEALCTMAEQLATMPAIAQAHESSSLSE